MKVRLDESLAHKLRFALTSHDVATAKHVGLSGIQNGELLQRAQALGFEVLVTGDRNLSHQQNPSKRITSLVVLSTNHWPVLKHLFSAIPEAVNGATPGSYCEVECGPFK